MSGRNAAEGCLQVLVSSLGLSVGLGVITRQNALHTCEVNCGPRSETISRGRPCSRNTCWVRRSAVSRAEGSLGRGTKCTPLEKRSTMVSMVVLPAEGGNPVTKSTAMWDHGRLGMGSGRSNPEEGWREAFPRAQTRHAAIKAWISCVMPVHQKRRRMNSSVRWIPGWQASLDAWPQTSTWDLREAGT